MMIIIYTYNLAHTSYICIVYILYNFSLYVFDFYETCFLTFQLLSETCEKSSYFCFSDFIPASISIKYGVSQLPAIVFREPYALSENFPNQSKNSLISWNIISHKKNSNFVIIDSIISCCSNFSKSCKECPTAVILNSMGDI